MTLGDFCAQLAVLAIILAMVKAWPHIEQFSDGNVGADE